MLHELESKRLVRCKVKIKTKAGPPKFDYSLTKKGEARLRELRVQMNLLVLMIDKALSHLNQPGSTGAGMGTNEPA
jgi:DNA-binding PadR family transcriptional regulator